MKNRNGFTLVEAVIVAVIIAILAAVSIPAYSAYVRGARIDAARSTCEIIGAAVIQTHNRGIGIDASDWGDVGLTNPSDESWNYTFPALGGSVTMTGAYAITATGRVGDLSGRTGTFLPRQSGSARWTGALVP